jgi:hypothetical protein
VSKIHVTLDAAFKVKPTLINHPEKKTKITYNITEFPKDDPCIMVLYYSKRDKDNTYTRTGIYKLPFALFLAKQKQVHIFHDKLGIKSTICFDEFKMSTDKKFTSDPTFDMRTVNMINTISQNVHNYIKKYLDFSRMPNVAIFYRDDLLYRMHVNTGLSTYHFESNPEFWLNLYNKYMEALKLLEKNFKNNYSMFKTMEYDPYVSWVDLITYIITRGYNYRTDVPKDSYSEPSYNKVGDCIATYVKIYMSDGSLKKVGDLKIGDMVMSYDFETQRYIKKPIINIWEKGVKPIQRVYFANGTCTDVTKNHPFWGKTSNGKYKKTLLSEIWNFDKKTWVYTSSYKRKVPFVKKIPYIVKDIKWLTEDHCFIIGFFYGDGWVHGKKRTVGIGSHKVPTLIIPKLKKYNIPFSTYTSNHNVPCIRILKSSFKDFLRKLKNNSFDMDIPEILRSLPQNKLKKFIEGHFEADGHYHKIKRGVVSKYVIEKIHSTSCGKFVMRLYDMFLKLGKCLYVWRQMKHGGLGKKPIYRLHDNEYFLYKRHYGYDGISEISIKSVKNVGTYRTRDFEVQDTHAYIFENGVVAHNCEGKYFFLILTYYYRLRWPCTDSLL